VAQLATYKGSVWATWDPEAPPFLDYLGDMALYLDELLDCRDGRPGGSEVLGVSKNGSCHRSVDLVGIGSSGRGRRDNERIQARRFNVSFPELGHGAHQSCS